MTSKLRPLLTALFAAGYLAQSLVLGVVHIHTGQQSQCDGQVGNCAASRVRVTHDHVHGHCHGSHEQAPAHGHDDSRSRQTPDHDHENCSICRHLVEKPLSAESVGPLLVSEIVEPIEVTAPIFYWVALTRTHFSRGPPAQCC